MSTRRARRILGTTTVSVGLALAAAGCGGAASSTSGAAHADPAPRYPAGSVVGVKVPTAVEDLPFVDQSGRTVHLSDFTGETVVVQDVMTLCQELCPIDTSTFVAAAQDWAAHSSHPDDVVFLSVTVDPQRDTPAQLAAYRHQYVGAASHLPQWRLLTGTPADVAALWKDLGVWVHRVPQDAKVTNWRTGQPLTYDVEHSDAAFFIDGTGEERYLLDGMPSLGTGRIPASLQRFMSADGHRNEAKHQGWTADQAVGVLGWITGDAGTTSG